MVDNGLLRDVPKIRSSMTTELDMFTDLHGTLVPKLNHSCDPPASFEAADRLKPDLSRLQALVLQAFSVHGPMTDEELELLPEFNAYGPSTIRKRRSELFHLRKLCSTGEKKNLRGFNMTIWGKR